MEGKNSLKKHNLFLIMLIAFLLSIVPQFAENGGFEYLTEVTVMAPGTDKMSYEQTSAFPDGIININTASVQALDTLEGIGESYAGRIIKYREETGRFEVIQDIMKVPGIGEKRFLKIKDKISVK